MPIQKKRVTFTVTILLGIAALITGLIISKYIYVKKVDIRQFHGTLLHKPREIEEFKLTGIDKKPFTNNSLQKQWTMIFFGFTSCGYVCPTTMAELDKMYRKLEEKKIRPLPRVVMITLDPERDNISKLANYIRAFNPHFYGATGQDKIIQQMTREMGIAYDKVMPPNANDSENYDIQHSGAVMLFNPQGELSAFFTTPHQAESLVKDYQLLVS